MAADGRSTRVLISLSLERRLSDRVSPELRRKVFDALAGSPRYTEHHERILEAVDTCLPVEKPR